MRIQQRHLHTAGSALLHLEFPTPFMSVLTEPGCTALTLMAVSRNSWARCTVQLFNALLEML